ncbi:membrane-bound O-acyltransferase family protein [Pseudobutyrivibrio ruminis]|uniref:Membrane-bound O-acyltransferase family protein n=1 Tax=Pseudobutyrivibrio ruminis TaxID=46206 RepID=A0A2G3EAT9_9FIRM|nr:MBOAT family O-acyltransferase [Pseudobutyrivibrio ruminis]PHU40354.1 membrane-bound O-acyltransferase family protein [Pseudobutyrivibrio ruminis]
MLFNSIDFLVFFPIVTTLYFVFPHKIRNYWLLAASYFFYMCWNPKYILLLMTSTFITYLSGIVMERIKQSDREENKKIKLKNWTVAASFVLNISMLFYFKYINFALDVMTDILGIFHISVKAPTFDVILPVGISFYIFQALSYTMDVYRDEIYAEKNIFRYALFVSFFPQLVAGPIERSKNLLKQLAKPNDFDYNNARTGLLMMLWGYFIKVVMADRLAVLVDTVYNDVSAYHGMELIVANLFFTIQIYCDFMGYSIIAKGAAKYLGYNLMSNFEMPYFSTSIKEFWRRWHISLSSWLRDYLYIPLGGNRKGTARKYFNLLLTFFVSGLWHGANITFVVWGMFHGICQVIEDIFRMIFGKISDRIKNVAIARVWKGINVLKTFILAAIGWVFFRASNISQAIQVLKASVKLDNVSEVLAGGGIYNLGIDKMGLIMLGIAVLLLFVVSIMRENKINPIEWISSKHFVVRYATYWLIVILIIFSLDLTGKEFIYFQF